LPDFMGIPPDLELLRRVNRMKRPVERAGTGLQVLRMHNAI
jgi:hypothetical protein